MFTERPVQGGLAAGGMSPQRIIVGSSFRLARTIFYHELAHLWDAVSPGIIPAYLIVRGREGFVSGATRAEFDFENFAEDFRIAMAPQEAISQTPPSNTIFGTPDEKMKNTLREFILSFPKRVMYGESAWVRIDGRKHVSGVILITEDWLHVEGFARRRAHVSLPHDEHHSRFIIVPPGHFSIKIPAPHYGRYILSTTAGSAIVVRVNKDFEIPTNSD